MGNGGQRGKLRDVDGCGRLFGGSLTEGGLAEFVG
jgi:hypothetical protein